MNVFDIKRLNYIANKFDSLGLHKEADSIDLFIINRLRKFGSAKPPREEREYFKDDYEVRGPLKGEEGWLADPEYGTDLLFRRWKELAERGKGLRGGGRPPEPPALNDPPYYDAPPLPNLPPASEEDIDPLEDAETEEVPVIQTFEESLKEGLENDGKFAHRDLHSGLSIEAIKTEMEGIYQLNVKLFDEVIYSKNYDSKNFNEIPNDYFDIYKYLTKYNEYREKEDKLNDAFFEKDKIIKWIDHIINKNRSNNKTAKLVGEESPDNSYMSISNIEKITEQSQYINNYLKDNEPIELEDWIENKISVSTDSIQSVYDYLKYRIER